MSQSALAERAGITPERGVRLAKAWDRLDTKKQTAILNLIEETAGR